MKGKLNMNNNDITIEVYFNKINTLIINTKRKVIKNINYEYRK